MDIISSQLFVLDRTKFLRGKIIFYNKCPHFTSMQNNRNGSVWINAFQNVMIQ